MPNRRLRSGCGAREWSGDNKGARPNSRRRLSPHKTAEGGCPHKTLPGAEPRAHTVIAVGTPWGSSEAAARVQLKECESSFAALRISGGGSDAA